MVTRQEACMLGKLWKLPPGPSDLDLMAKSRGGKFTWSRPPDPSASQVILQFAPAPIPQARTHSRPSSPPHGASRLTPLIPFHLLAPSQPPSTIAPSPAPGSPLASPPQEARRPRHCPPGDSPSAAAPGVESPGVARLRPWSLQVSPLEDLGTQVEVTSSPLESPRAAARGPRRRLLQVPAHRIARLLLQVPPSMPDCPTEGPSWIRRQEKAKSKMQKMNLYMKSSTKCVWSILCNGACVFCAIAHEQCVHDQKWEQ
jgi:hypothetical protein